MGPGGGGGVCGVERGSVFKHTSTWLNYASLHDEFLELDPANPGNISQMK